AWPARDAVPATAEAVAFNDEAELLACLGGDLASGGIAARWWWPLLVEGLAEPRRAVAAAWIAAAEHAPAALQRLSERRAAEAFVRALAPHDRPRLIAAIEECFALPAFAAPGSTREGIPPATAGGGAGARAAPAAPWRAWVDEAEMPDLAPPERELLGIAPALVRAAEALRGATFATELAVR